MRSFPDDDNVAGGIIPVLWNVISVSLYSHGVVSHIHDTVKPIQSQIGPIKSINYAHR